MRKLIVSNIVPLDGYYASPGNGTSVLPMDGAFDAYNAERLRAAGTLLLGRASYDMLRGFRPTVAEDPDATPAEREVSLLVNTIGKVVVSDSLTAEQTEPWHDTRKRPHGGRLRADRRARASNRQRRPGFGSRTLWNGLLARDLVDELHLMIGPVVLCAGTALFDGRPPSSPRLIGTRTWDGSENVLARYDVSRRETLIRGRGQQGSIRPHRRRGRRRASTRRVPSAPTPGSVRVDGEHRNQRGGRR